MNNAYEELESKLRPLLYSRKVTIVGIGNILHGDDGIGVLIAQEIKNTAKNTNVIIAATTPENVLTPIVRSKPDLILILDAADFGAKIGSIAVFDPSTVEDEAYLGATHALPVSMFASALKRELPEVEILIIGIQAGYGFFGSKVSEEVRRAANWVISFMGKVDSYLIEAKK
jgi:hydrogenase 3 maturation protease